MELYHTAIKHVHWVIFQEMGDFVLSALCTCWHLQPHGQTKLGAAQARRKVQWSQRNWPQLSASVHKGQVLSVRSRGHRTIFTLAPSISATLWKVTAVFSHVQSPYTASARVWCQRGIESHVVTILRVFKDSESCTVNWGTLAQFSSNAASSLQIWAMHRTWVML